jgi:hypothetical protein
MKLNISKKLSIVLISAFIASAGITWACAWFEEYDWDVSFFSPESISTTGYEPMYRSNLKFYKTDRFESHVSDFDSINVAEWQTYFQNKVTETDLHYYLYKARIGEVDTTIFALRDPKFKAPNTIRNSSLFKSGNNVATKDFLFYLGFAKRCEPFACYVPDYWSDNQNDPRQDTEAMQKLIDGGFKQIANVKDAFIRERYLFQIIRLSYMMGDYGACQNIYNQNKTLITGNNSIT